MVTTNQKFQPGILISLPGMLKRAAECCKRSKDSSHLGFCLQQLLTHLEMVRANPERVSEFFDLYVDE